MRTVESYLEWEDRRELASASKLCRARFQPPAVRWYVPDEAMEEALARGEVPKPPSGVCWAQTSACLPAGAWELAGAKLDAVVEGLRGLGALSSEWIETGGSCATHWSQIGELSLWQVVRSQSRVAVSLGAGVKTAALRFASSRGGLATVRVETEARELQALELSAQMHMPAVLEMPVAPPRLERMTLSCVAASSWAQPGLSAAAAGARVMMLEEANLSLGLSALAQAEELSVIRNGAPLVDLRAGAHLRELLLRECYWANPGPETLNGLGGVGRVTLIDCFQVRDLTWMGAAVRKLSLCSTKFPQPIDGPAELRDRDLVWLVGVDLAVQAFRNVAHVKLASGQCRAPRLRLEDVESCEVSEMTGLTFLELRASRACSRRVITVRHCPNLTSLSVVLTEGAGNNPDALLEVRVANCPMLKVQDLQTGAVRVVVEQ